MEKQSIRDLLSNPIIYYEYPYQYKKVNEDGTITFTFSKTPKIEPSLVEIANIERHIETTIEYFEQLKLLEKIRR